MAVIYSTAAKTARMSSVNDLVPGGQLRIYTAGQATELARFTLTTPAGTVAADVWTLDMDPDLSTTGLADGTAAVATINNSGGTEVITGLTVGTSGTDVVLDNTSITTGQTVTMATGAITHAA